MVRSVKTPSVITETRIQRFTAAERIVHWLVALAFIYVALTGLALWSPRLYWLSAVFGGGTTVRAWHPWSGVLFILFFAFMFGAWRTQMKLDRDDRRWLRLAHKYAVHQYADLPESGRFNGGQKSLFWMQAIAGVLLLLSGAVLWFPESMPRLLRDLAVLVHPIAAILSICGIIVHIYMGTAAVPGSLRGMTQGWVSSGWAAAHHPKWYREIRRS
jgi:formate dehydrogenase subunit gamma